MKHKLNTRKRTKIFSVFLTIVAVFLTLECNTRFPDNINLFEGEPLLVRSSSPYTLSMPAGFSGTLENDNTVTQKDISDNQQYVTVNDTGSYCASVKLFGIIPVRSVNINVLEQEEIVPCGNTIGIKMFTKGLICVGTSEISEASGKLFNIAGENDIKIGDIILSANGEELNTTERFSVIISKSDGNALEIVIDRNGAQYKKSITPVLTSDGYKLGLWVRDSTAGIGTLTFYDDKSNKFGALGHPITDSDTGRLMPVSSGTIVGANIIGVKKGEKGKPGELKGVFDAQSGDIGVIEKNTPQGIYGTLNVLNIDNIKDKIPIASRNRIREGAAQIISNINEKEVEVFNIEIQRVMLTNTDGNKDLVIKVTDDNLLARTGGIVQGMSGSPIIQDGAIVGAVTHVFVNDPTRGYGVFIDSMLRNIE